MSTAWIPWKDRWFDFAPIISPHSLEPFYPTTVDSFLNESSCGFWVLTGTTPSGQKYGQVKDFNKLSHLKKCQTMLLPEHKDFYPSLRMHNDRVDMKASEKIQKKYLRTVYYRGFRNKDTGEAYITYWFFYMENFQPAESDHGKIKSTLDEFPDDWWTHQGDWEGISVHFADYKDEFPLEVCFAQHTHVQRVPWQKVRLEDERILVCAALGSHASYNHPVNQTQAGIYCEIAEYNPDLLLEPADGSSSKKSDYILEELDPSDQNKIWISFDGRWGKSGGVVTGAPTGPIMKDDPCFLLRADISKYKRKP